MASDMGLQEGFAMGGEVTRQRGGGLPRLHCQAGMVVVVVANVVALLVKVDEPLRVYRQ